MDRAPRHLLKELLRDIAGASAAGVAAVCHVDDASVELYRRWIAAGRHADMAYLERYDDVRRDPGLLLEGARSIIVGAFSYANPGVTERMRSEGRPVIAEYALGSDYHTELRRRMDAVGKELTGRFGGKYRVCIDTAPLRERYWAKQAGVGFVGRNNYIIVPGLGAHFFLASLLWSGEPADGYDTPCDAECDGCGACAAACPTGALDGEGGCDARRCISFLTIESREPLPDGIATRGQLFGCDICRKVCPHEPAQPDVTTIDDFRARPEVSNLTAEDWAIMTKERFNDIFRDSAVKRAKLDKLKANVRRI